MRPVEFAEQNTVFAKDQPEYQPLPANVCSFSGTVTCVWKLSLRERLRLLWTGLLWHQVRTYNKPLQPQLLLTEKPIYLTPVEDKS